MYVNSSFLKKKVYFHLFIYLFMAVLGLLCCTQAFFSCSKWRLLSSCSVQASLVVEDKDLEHRLSSCGVQA